MWPVWFAFFMVQRLDNARRNGRFWLVQRSETSLNRSDLLRLLSFE